MASTDKAYYKARARFDAATNPLAHRESPKPPSKSATLSRSLSGSSTLSSYSSDYSTESREDEAFSESDRSTTKSRSNMPSPGGKDRRRVAIVQMDALSASGTSSPASSIRSRRGLPSNLAGLALVAPPDASSTTYTHLTPPLSTAPVATATQENSRHFRSMSEHPSRDDTPTINNETNPINNPSVPPSSSTSTAGRPIPATVSYDSPRALLSPTGIMSGQRPAFSPPIITPEIGASKEIHIPVAAPVVVDLSSKDAVQTRAPRSNSSVKPSVRPVESNSSVAASSLPLASAPGTFDPVLTSGFVNYKPGVDATAGPLPLPPQTRFDMINLRTPPPPRPPRLHSPAPPRPKNDLEAMKQALQLPPSVAAKLAKTTVKSGAAPTAARQLGETKPLRVNSKRGIDKAVVEDLSLSNTQHRREGAFPSIPETQDLGASVSSNESSYSVDELSQRPIVDDNDDSVPNVTVVKEEEAPKAAETMDERRQEDATSSFSLSSSKRNHNERSSWIEGRSFISPSPENGARVSFEDDRPSPRSSLSRSSSVSPRSTRTGPAPSPPPKSFRNSLTTGLKRLSTLPKSPGRSLSLRSVSSGSISAQHRRVSSGTHQGYSSSRTPSPSLNHSRRGATSGRKIIDFNPAAMFCHEVHQQRTTAERCAIYASKINELYVHDCGLGNWVVQMKVRTSHPQPRGSPSKPYPQQPRHTSGSSMISEATFPRRPDASTATDLSPQPSPLFQGSSSPISVPVSLPYPSLANQQRQQSIRSTATSSSNGTPPSSVRSLVAPSNPLSLSLSGPKTGFFASLGRKASLSTASRKDRGGLTPAHANGSRTVLTKSPPVVTPINPTTTTTKDMISKPLHIPTTQLAVPNGPRAPGSSMRVQRSKTLMTSVSPSYQTRIEKDEVLGRRPSLFNIASESNDAGYSSDYHGGRNALEIQTTYSDPEFAAQVERLHTLIPHADRTVLAGYLRRAGQDVLAIGQYLEDEKNGTLKF